MLNNILIATSAPPDRGSGISTYSKEIAIELRQRGTKVVYASPRPKDDAWVQKWDILHFPIAPDSDQVAIAGRLLDLIRREKIEAAINSDNSILQSISPAMACPVIAIGHLDRSAIAKVACFNATWIDHVVAISSDMQHDYVNKFGVPINKCPIIYNGLQDPGPSPMPAYDRRCNLKVIFAGEYSRRKGGDLVEKMILSRHPVWKHIRLDWFGRVPENKRRTLSANPSVNIHGRVPRRQLLEALKRADVFLLASRREGCPMAMIEAMSFGVVPIASDGVGAMRGLLTSGYDGYICSLKDWPLQALRCLENMVEHPGKLRSLRTHTRNRFLSELTTTKVVDQLLELLRTPSVDRHHPQTHIRILKWHRLPAGGSRSSILERIFFKFGILRYAGWLDVDSF